MNNKLEITDLSKLKITKIKEAYYIYAIFFTYDSDKYLLHHSDAEYESSTTLYKRVPLNNCGKYDLEIIRNIGDVALSSFLRINNKIDNKYIKYSLSNCYCQIDKKFFAKRLTYHGLVSGIYDDYIKELWKQKNKIDNEIQSLKTKQRELEIKSTYIFYDMKEV